MVEPSSLKVGEREYSIFRIDGLENAASLPYTLRILLENVARAGSEEGIAAVTGWDAHAEPSREISYAVFCLKKKNLAGTFGTTRRCSPGCSVPSGDGAPRTAFLRRSCGHRAQ